MGPALLLLTLAPLLGQPEGLLFHASFDQLTTTADFARGSGRSTLTANLEIRSAEGIRGAGLLQRPDERCSYPIAGNLNTSQGSFAIWVKPLSWEGKSRKFRHLLVATPSKAYTMMVYLYPIGDEAVFNYLSLDSGQPTAATWRAGAPVDMWRKGEWTHIVSTWGPTEVKLYANGRRVGEGRVGAPLPRLETGDFTICPVDWWRHKQWGDPEEQTICDEARIYDHPLSDEEVLDLYASELPGGLAELKPKLAVALRPDYARRTITATLRGAHLDAATQAALPAPARLVLQDPRGNSCYDNQIPLTAGGAEVRIDLPGWLDGEYRATATLQAGAASLSGTGTLLKPPTPWLLPQTDWRADRVLPPWRPLERAGDTIRTWGGSIRLGGPFPTAVEQAGGAVTAGAIRLAGTPASWEPPTVTEELPQRVTVAGRGQVGALSAVYGTLVEFDGLCRVDLTLTPPRDGAELSDLVLEIPLRAEVASWYRRPQNREWDGQSLDEPGFVPYAWLGNDRRGLAWFMESEANQARGEGQPALSLRREGEVVVARLRLIGRPVRVTSPLTYTFGFEPTPVRPAEPGFYDLRFASGPQYQGSNLFVYGWGKQISYLNARLLAHEPEAQRALVAQWRAADKHALAYTCAQCTADISPEYQFFSAEWSQPYGATFAGYKRVPDDAPYSIVGVCPRSSFADFLVWCAEQHLEQQWGDGIYTDLDGAFTCDNNLHGCGYTDALGGRGRTIPFYAHRALSRRLYAACRDRGKPYFSHAHSEWYAPFNAFNDGWCPGEQFSSQVVGNPTFYMTSIPDRVWRSEFLTATTGVRTFLLPQFGRLEPSQAEDRAAAVSCIVAAMTYGAPLWGGYRPVTEEVWAAQQAFGMGDVEFVPFWQQREVAVSSPAARVSAWRKPGKRLLVVANFGAEPLPLTLTAAGATFAAAWNAAGLQASPGAASLTLPAYSGALVTATGLP